MLARCNGSWWKIDDFSTCFQRKYLEFILPLVVCGASLLYLSIQSIRRTVKIKRSNRYKQIPNGHNEHAPHRFFDDTTDTSDSASDDNDDLQSRHLSIVRTQSITNESIVQVDKPKGEVVIVVVEELAVIGEVVIHVIAIIANSGGIHGRTAAIAGLVSWVYILTLASLRLMFSASATLSFPKLWYHTAFLYGFQWLFMLPLFRSVIIHPRSEFQQILVITNFALVSVLTLIALTSRKGNKVVVLAYEDGLEPSREPLASLLSLATFSWVDPIVWKGYKKTYEMLDVWNLAPKDRAPAVLEHYRQVKKTSSLAFHLLGYFQKSLWIQAAWAVFSAFFTFGPTLLLKAILEYVENPGDTPKNAAWLYIILLFALACISALADGQALWIGRQVCIRLKAIIIGEIYSKALRRKAAAGTDTVLGAKGDENKQKPGLLNKVTSFGRKKAQSQKVKAEEATKSKSEATGDSQVNTGTIINLMAVDSFKVAEICAYLHFLWASVPVQIIVAVTLLYRIMGYSSIAGIGIMTLLLPTNIFIARRFQKIQKRIMAATDGRIHTTNEVLQNIRIIKFFAWEQRFTGIVNEKRSIELKELRYRYILWTMAATVWYGAPMLITLLSFFVYTMIEKKDLIPSVAFTALSLFSILRIPLDQLADMLAHVQEAKVSVDRVEEFLNEEETDKYTQLTRRNEDEDDNSDPFIGFNDATFSWGSKTKPDEAESEAFKLINVNVRFEVAQLNIIAGPTGSGKTSMLMALLGEMTLLNGDVFLPGGEAREDLRPNFETGLTESVAYCAQQAWLVNDTIKQNILFASPWDKRRYDSVIIACCLARDLETFEAGDETLVGEKGITLSGGQKQRISLARALYSNSRHILLDDCLSAVDSHTAKWLFEYCIMGPLMYNRTCILVTHNIALCVPAAYHVVVLENGKIVAQGKPKTVMASGALGEDILKSRPQSKLNSQLPSRVPSDVGLDEAIPESTSRRNSQAAENGNINGNTKAKTGDGKANTRTEEKATGGVKWQVIFLYLRMMGGWPFWFLAVAVFAFQQVGSVVPNIWIRQWANSYQTKSLHAIGTQPRAQTINYFRMPSNSFGASCLRTGTCAWNLPSFTITSFYTAQNDNEVDASYYLTVYALFAILYIIISMSREFVLFMGSLSASWKIHEKLLESITRAKFRFFDSTPLGQIMNRFSKDIEAIDQEVAPVAIGMIHCLASVFTIVILITIITPGFIIPGIFISAMYFFIGQFYLRSSVDLKRLESVQRSPLYQQFGETLSGITTIRAYGDERRFIRDNLARCDTHNRPFYYLWAANRWLSFRVDIAGAFVSFFAGVFVILRVGKIDAGAAGLSLTYAVTFSENVLWLVRLYSVNEQNMNSVERVKEYLDVDQEAPAIIAAKRPANTWPEKGAVEFENYTTRYRADLEPVLNDVSFKIKPFEKVGIVGRTGAGKSSLALALFRALEAEQGKIVIDDVNISTIGLKDLREAVTMVPQDPTLFTGTIRSNLDPFGLFTDEEIFTSLRRVQLIGTDHGSASNTPSPPSTRPHSPSNESEPSSPTTTSNKNIFLNLSSPVTESGNNLSQGQRQLLCLARAMLKMPKVLLMDEATASIDYNTDSKIQETIRELKGTTITIAHRLQTIIDYDKVLVLDKGRVVEFGHPWDLLKPNDSDAEVVGESRMFRAMCETSGELPVLEEMAKKAWMAKRLVDDS